MTDVDLAAQTIYVPHAKAGARVQPISPDLVGFLVSYVKSLPSGTPWLFPSVGTLHGHTVDIRKPFVRSVIRAGLNPQQVVRHTLRHTAITHLVQAGVDLPTVKRISGHKTLAMVERYAHQSGMHIAAALEKLDAQYRAKSRIRLRAKRRISDCPMSKRHTMRHTGHNPSCPASICRP